MERTREPDLPDDEAADARRRIEKQLELDEDRETKACQPLAEACKRGGCIPTWSHALQKGRASCAGNPRASVSVSTHCGGFNVLEEVGRDASYTWYFSSNTSKLVGKRVSGQGAGCVGTVPETGSCRSNLICQDGELQPADVAAPCSCKTDDPLCVCL
jgi:hypothetical protein